jgi:hypothetical protein
MSFEKASLAEAFLFLLFSYIQFIGGVVFSQGLKWLVFTFAYR